MTTYIHFPAPHGAPATPHGRVHHNCLMRDGPLERLHRRRFPLSGKIQTLQTQVGFHSSDGTMPLPLYTAGSGILRMTEHMALPAIRNGLPAPPLAA